MQDLTLPHAGYSEPAASGAIPKPGFPERAFASLCAVATALLGCELHVGAVVRRLFGRLPHFARIFDAHAAVVLEIEMDLPRVRPLK
jgi:hypothetical protein